MNELIDLMLLQYPAGYQKEKENKNEVEEEEAATPSKSKRKRKSQGSGECCWLSYTTPFAFIFSFLDEYICDVNVIDAWGSK